MENFIITAIIATILSASVGYIRREKKRGVKCIGCPSGCSCNGNCGGTCNGCGSNKKN